MKCIDFLGFVFIFTFYSFYCIFSSCSAKKDKELDHIYSYEEELDSEATKITICCSPEPSSEKRTRSNSRFFAGIDDFEDDLT
jgi:hypothetical protein